MFMSTSINITQLQRVFLEPKNSTHRQYEALRCFIVEGVKGSEVAKRFGYAPGSLRGLVHELRQNPGRQFFVAPAKGPQSAPKADSVRDQVINLRKQNMSIYDISRALTKEGKPISPVAVSLILKEQGFARLPRRMDEERPERTRAITAAVADCRVLDLTPRQIKTRFGGLFLFLPFLARLPFDDIMEKVGLPGTRMIPAAHAIRSLLALKLFGTARHSHVMSAVLDEGLGLFAGLNVIPKRSFLTEYSCRIHPSVFPKLMQEWFDAMSILKLPRGNSFDLDFHTIPFHGENALVEKHYVSKRSRRQKGILCFLANDADAHVFCYANGNIRKSSQNDEILRFAEFWKKRTGKFPEELIFDSKLTTYKNLNELNNLEIPFITLRRRSKKLLQEIALIPPSTWRRIELKGVSRIYKTPKILDQIISLDDYDKPIRQIVIKDLGHEEPTLLVTNQLKRSPVTLLERYAKRMLIENEIQDGVDFFHMDALSSAVAMKVNCDLMLTLMASSLYRIFALKIGNGYHSAKSRHIFRDFIEASAVISITNKEINVRFQKRAHNPLLLAANLDKSPITVPWLNNRKLTLSFG